MVTDILVNIGFFLLTVYGLYADDIFYVLKVASFP